MHFHLVSAIKKGGFNHVVIYPSKKAAQYLNAPPIVIVWPTKIGALPSKIEDHLCIMIRNFNHQERWLHMFLPLKCLPHTKNNMYILYSFKIIVIIIMIIMINININIIYIYILHTHTHTYVCVFRTEDIYLTLCFLLFQNQPFEIYQTWNSSSHYRFVGIIGVILR